MCRVFSSGRVRAGLPPNTVWLTRADPYPQSPEAAKGKQGGRALEIQCLIASSLRAAVDLSKLGEYTITLDCDVLHRTVSITGACVALADALASMQKKGQLNTNPMKGFVAVISVSIVAGEAVCDLEYVED